MSASADSFSVLLDRARAGDDGAVDRLVRLYEPDLRIAARVHLGTALRPYLDSVDLVQSVHRSILRGLHDDRFALTHPGSLIALALTMVRRKVARQWRKHRRQARFDTEMGPPPADVLSTLSCTPPAGERDVASRDAVDRLWAELDDTDREFLAFRLQGLTTTEAADRMRTTPERLRVRLFRLRGRLRETGLLSEWL
jgi:RNA polymerase sigma-70 factor (ECF subfamily)